MSDVQLGSFLQPLNVGLQKLEDVEEDGEEDDGKDVDKQALLLETRLVERCRDWNPEREKTLIHTFRKFRNKNIYQP